MKKYFFGLIMISIPVIMHAQDGYTVEGNIAGLTDGTIQMKKVYDGKVLNEAQVKNGKFIFKQEGKFLGDKVMLAGAGLRGRVDFYIEPGRIKLDGDASKGVQASGTSSNDAQTEYLRAVAPIEARIKELRMQMKDEKDKTKNDKLLAELTYQYDSLFYPMRKAFAIKYNNTILAPEFLSAGTGDLTFSDMKKLIALLDPKTPENWYTNRLKKRCDILGKTDFGQVLPDFTLPDTSGAAVTFSSLRGKIVLVDFWASWCVPCRQENQNVLKLYEKYNKDGFTVISVSIDDKKEKWLEAIKHDKLPWYHVSSLTGWDCPVANNLGVTYGMSGVPYTLLVGRDGKVIGHNVRGEKLEERLRELFNKN